MVMCVTPEDVARTSRPTSEVEGGSMLHVLGQAQAVNGPLAFIASQEEVCVLPTHFHAADQFQVIIKGRGRIGGHPVAPGTIHYSDAFTPYGPVTPAPEGLSYLTLRPRYNYAYHTLPECRELLKQKMQEHRGSQKIVETDLEARTATAERLLWQRADGVAIARIDVEASATVTLTPVPLGRFCLVMRGGVTHEWRDCPEGTCLWIDAQEQASPLTGSTGGAVLLLLSFAPQH